MIIPLTYYLFNQWYNFHKGNKYRSTCSFLKKVLCFKDKSLSVIFRRWQIYFYFNIFYGFYSIVILLPCRTENISFLAHDSLFKLALESIWKKFSRLWHLPCYLVCQVFHIYLVCFVFNHFSKKFRFILMSYI